MSLISLPAARQPAELLHGAVREAAAVIGQRLPAAAPVQVQPPQPFAAAELRELVTEPSAKAVVADVRGGVTGRLGLLLCGDVVTAVTEGPLAGSDVTASMADTVTAAAGALADVLGTEVTLGIAETVDADAVHFRDGALTVALADGETVLGALVVDIDPPEVPDAVSDEAATFTPFGEDQPVVPAQRSLELLHDVEMAVTVELGRTRMAVSELLALAPGAVVELDRVAGSPVDVLVNGKLLARGEVVVVDEDFGIRISEILGLEQKRL